MKQLVILIPNGRCNLSSIAGAFKILTRAGDFWRAQGKDDLFEIRLAGTAREIRLEEDVFSIRPHASISEIPRADLVIIPALNHPVRDFVEPNRMLLDWVRQQYEAGAQIASICTGAFLLAATGLLDGRKCSTHWMVADAFHEMFPLVELAVDRIITDEGGIYTNGGAFSFLHLMVYLVEKYYDRTTALRCAKVFQIDMDRDSQSPYAMFSGQKRHQDELVLKAQSFLEKHYPDKFSIDDLAHRLATGRRNLDRRFLKATGNTPTEYLLRTRVEVAKRHLETSMKSVKEVMYETGYTDTKAFRQTFKKITGLSPLSYQKKYNKESGSSGMLV